jgi:hypothetical protein
MAAPSTAITRLDLSIGYNEFNLLANINKFIGLLVLPPLGVDQEGADFRKIVIKELLKKIEDTRRAAKGTYARDDWEWTKDSYAVEEHGVEEVVDDATVEKYGDVIRSEQLATVRGLIRVLQRLEYDIAAAVFNTSTWTGASLTTAVTPWNSAPTTVDPLADIDAAHLKVNSNCGEDANTLVLTKKAYTSLIRTTRIEGLLKYNASEVLFAMQSGQNEKMVKQIMSGLCDLLQVEQILVARGFKNTADQGQTASLSRVWDDTKAMLCVTHNDGLEGDLENPMPQIGRTIFSTKNGEPMPGGDDGGVGAIIWDEYRDDTVRGSVMRPRTKYQVKILHPEAGHLLTAVTN